MNSIWMGRSSIPHRSATRLGDLDKVERFGVCNLGKSSSFQFGRRYAAGTDASGRVELARVGFWRRQAAVQQLAP